MEEKIINIEEKTPNPKNRNILLEISLSKFVIDRFYPITPDGKRNLTEEDLMRVTSMNDTMSFEDAITTIDFFDLFWRKINNRYVLAEAKVLKVPPKNKEEYGMLEGKKVFLSANSFGNAPQLFYDLLPNTGILKTFLTKPQFIIAYMENNAYKPFGENVEYEFDMPSDFVSKMEEQDLKIGEGGLTLEFIRSHFREMGLGQNYATISAVGDRVTECKVGDRVIIVPNHNFSLADVVRVSEDNKKIYFIKSQEFIVASDVR